MKRSLVEAGQLIHVGKCDQEVDDSTMFIPAFGGASPSCLRLLAHDLYRRRRNRLGIEGTRARGKATGFQQERDQVRELLCG